MMKLISENYNFDKELERRVRHYNRVDLFFNSTGYACLKDFETQKIIKNFMPNNKGYIKIGKTPINFKRMLFKVTYPNLDISNKIVVSFGKTYNILNLVALTRNEFINIKKHKKTVVKNQKTGEIQIR